MLPEKFRTRGWTGEPDVVAAKALGLALAIGALGFLIIGAIALH